MHLRKLPWWQRIIVRFFRVIMTSVRRFIDDGCTLRASALTYYLMLSLVPILAAAIGVARGFNLDKTLESSLLERFPEQAEVLTMAMSFASSALERASGGVLAGWGVILLFWSVTSMLVGIENTFNKIWNVREGRSWMRRFSDYLAMIVVLPILFIVASSVSVMYPTQLLPFFFTWLLFAVIYLFMPNTKVPFRAALVGGIVAGSAYQLLQWAYLSFQIIAASYGAVYGSFAALPLFLIWAQLSWTILLVGAELCYASQHVAVWEYIHDVDKVSHAFRRLVAVLTSQRIVSRFIAGKPAADAETLAADLELPLTLMRQTVQHLEQADILIAVAGTTRGRTCYQPRRDVKTLTVADVVDAIDHRGSDAIPIQGVPKVKAARTTLEAMEQAIHKGPAKVALKDL